MWIVKKKIPQNIRKFHKNWIPAFVRQKQGSVISATATESQPRSQNQSKKEEICGLNPLLNMEYCGPISDLTDLCFGGNEE